MAEIPSGFVGAVVKSPDSTLQLVSTHTLLGFAEQEHGNKPNGQGQVSVMENCVAGHRELILTSDTFIACILFKPRNAGVFTARAGYPFGLAQAFKQFAAAVVSRIQIINFRESHGSTS